MQVIVGNKKFIKKTEEDCAKCPTIIQGFTVKRVKEERYLGMIISSGTLVEIIDRNIRDKVSKLHSKTQKMRKIVRNDTISHMGMLKCAALLIQAIVIPVITYSCQAWIKISRKQYDKLEGIFRDTIAEIIGLPKTSNHEVLIHEVGQYHLVMDRRTKNKICPEKIT